MMKKIILLTAAIGFIAFGMMAQTHAKKADYSFLKGEKSFNIEYVYEDMTVGKKLTEEEYVNKKVEDYNKKEAGKGDKWKISWEESRTKRYEPKFETLINKSMAKINMTASKNSDAKYTLIVKTIYTEPGYNIGISKRPAFVNFEFSFIETATKNVMHTSILHKVPGAQAMGYDFDTGSRIAECYAKGGKMLGAYIYKFHK